MTGIWYCVYCARGLMSMASHVVLLSGATYEEFPDRGVQAVVTLDARLTRV